MSILEQAEQVVVEAQEKQALAPTATTFDVLAYERGILSILLAWGVGSVVYGIRQMSHEAPEAKGAATQHIAWGAIDAALAINGLKNNRAQQIDYDNGSILEYKLNRKATMLETILWVNTGLDVLYMAWGNSLTHDERPQRKGWGKAIIAQGLFLFLFDGISAYRLRKKRNG